MLIEVNLTQSRKAAKKRGRKKADATVPNGLNNLVVFFA